MGIKGLIHKIVKKSIEWTFIKTYGHNHPITHILLNVEEDNILYNRNQFVNSTKGVYTNIAPKYAILGSDIGDYTYISQDSIIHHTSIGKFCSIGPNFLCGWGIHPTDGISTAPMFYSTRKQNGMTLSNEDKIVETKRITIGNDVFIGMNVTILDGITVGDGAIIGAGCVVSKDIPPYAIAVGNPMKIIKYRFDEDTIKSLLELKWWNWDIEKLQEVETNFFDVKSFVKKHSN